MHRNRFAQSSWLKYNWIGQLVLTNASVSFTIIILFIVAYGVGSGWHDKRILFPQKVGASLWCAPVYFLTALFGYRSWTYGENTSLISFIVMNLIQLALCALELDMSFEVLADEDTMSMAVVRLVSTYEAVH